MQTSGSMTEFERRHCRLCPKAAPFGLLAVRVLAGSAAYAHG